jgi:hypothetical protein
MYMHLYKQPLLWPAWFPGLGRHHPSNPDHRMDNQLHGASVTTDPWSEKFRRNYIPEIQINKTWLGWYTYVNIKKIHIYIYNQIKYIVIYKNSKLYIYIL